MTCEYFSRKGERVFCKSYGILNATQGKIAECESDFHDCFGQANQFLKDETRRNTSFSSIDSSIPLAVFNRRQNSIYF